MIKGISIVNKIHDDYVFFVFNVLIVDLIIKIIRIHKLGNKSNNIILNNVFNNHRKNDVEVIYVAFNVNYLYVSVYYVWLVKDWCIVIEMVIIVDLIIYNIILNIHSIYVMDISNYYFEVMDMEINNKLGDWYVDCMKADSIITVVSIYRFMNQVYFII